MCTVHNRVKSSLQEDGLKLIWYIENFFVLIYIIEVTYGACLKVFVPP